MKRYRQENCTERTGNKELKMEKGDEDGNMT